LASLLNSPTHYHEKLVHMLLIPADRFKNQDLIHGRLVQKFWGL